MQYLFVPQVGRPIFDAKLPKCTGAPGEKPGNNCGATLFSEGFLFDERDAINRRDFFSYGLTTRLLGRGPTAAESAAPAAESAPPAPALTPVDPETPPPGPSAAALPDPVRPPVP